MRRFPSGPLEQLRQIRIDDLKLYMRWYLDKHHIKKLNTFCQNALLENDVCA